MPHGSADIPPGVLSAIADAIRSRTGWELHAIEPARLAKVLLARAGAAQLDPTRYAQRLLGQRAAADEEWRALIGALAINESFFFRDAGQFRLLRERILPELVRERRAARSLKIWSAGCSTGEEPYSLAILLCELLPTREGWDLSVIGTDLDDHALLSARRGRYHDWSLRSIAPEERRYFRRTGDEWELDPRVRSMVRFQRGSLLEDPLPSPASGLAEVDLILCRNVFIYFQRDAVRSVTEKLAAVLRPGGYLLTGHAELHGQQLAGLERVSFPQSLAYRRPRPDGEHRMETTGRVFTTLLPRPTTTTRAPVSTPRRLEVVPVPKVAAAPPATQTADALVERAWALANAGQRGAARTACAEALRLDPVHPSLHFLLAQLSDEEGDAAGARSLLKRCIYLDPGFIAAYLNLADSYAHEGDAERARRMRDAAVDRLRRLPPDAVPKHLNGATAAELLRQLATPTAGNL